MTTLDIGALRARFPALALRHDGQPFVYFDGPGGTQVPETVIDAVATYYRTSNANHEGAFATSRVSDAVVDEAHAALADFLGVDPDEIIVGANMTTLTFHVSRSITATFVPGDEIVVTGLDHAANVDPWIAAAGDRGLVVRWWEPRLEDCTLHLDDLRALLSPRTRLVAAGWASNAVGNHQPGRRDRSPGPRRRGLGLHRCRARRPAPVHRRPGRRRRLRGLLDVQVLRAAPRRRVRPAGDPRGPARLQGPAGRVALRDRDRQFRGPGRCPRRGPVPRGRRGHGRRFGATPAAARSSSPR